MKLILVILVFLSFSVKGQWYGVGVDQVEITAQHPALIQGATCSWWLMDKSIPTRIGGIYTKQMPSNSLQTSFNGYYNLQRVELGLDHWKQYHGCVVCSNVPDTLEVALDQIGVWSQVQSNVIGSWLYVGAGWSGQVFYLDSLVWDYSLPVVTNIQNIVWSGMSYNHSWINNGVAYKYDKKYAIIVVTAPGGYMNYSVYQFGGNVIFKMLLGGVGVIEITNNGKGKIISRRKKIGQS